MEFLPADIEDYAEEHTSPDSALLAKLARDTEAKILQPRMLSGHLQGRTLSFISKLKKPNRILEIGTYTGYSALCLAEGLAPKGKLISIDINDELKPFAQSYIDQSEHKESIQLVTGNALDVIPSILDQQDLVFIDADKNNYLNYYNLILPKLKSGGIIIADNVLWSGKVLDPKADDPDTAGLKKFNAYVKEDPRVENLLLPIRDGLLIMRKVGN